MTDTNNHASKLNLGSVFEDFNEAAPSPDSQSFLNQADHESVKIAQFVNNQQAFSPENLFFGNTAAPTMSLDEQSFENVQKSQSTLVARHNHSIAATEEENLDDEDIAKYDGSEEDGVPVESVSKQALGVRYYDVEYQDNDLIAAIKPAFIKQYYLRFITNACINLVTNPTVQKVKSAQMRKFYYKRLLPAVNLSLNANDRLDSKLAQSLANDISRHEKEDESRLVYWHDAQLSSMHLNNRKFTPVTSHDVILPVFDNIFSRCNNQNIAANLLSNYKTLYMKLPLNNKNYADSLDLHHNPQYVNKLTSLQQSMNFLRTTSWYIFSFELNGVFTNKRRKTLSYARGYLLALCEHYSSKDVDLTGVRIKALGEAVRSLIYWVESADHSYFNITSTKPHVSRRYSHHSIPPHQLSFEVLSMLSKPIIKNEPLNNLNYDINNGRLYLAGMNETSRFWINQLSDIAETDTTKVKNLRNSILKLAAKKARTFYPPSALYLED